MSYPILGQVKMKKRACRIGHHLVDISKFIFSTKDFSNAPNILKKLKTILFVKYSSH
jgi:hypothetical protein